MGLVVTLPRVRVDPLRVTAPVSLPMSSVAPAPEERMVFPEDEAVVKAPVDGVVAPMAVELIPVAVVLKLPEVTVKLLTPVLMAEADRPDNVSAPDVAVKDNAPVVWVKPLEAVNVPADVTAPVPVVEMFPVVDSVPSSLIVKESTPPVWIARDVLAAPPAVSLMIKALPVPALVNESEVCVPRPEARVKSMFLPVVVVMVFPPV